MPVLFDASTLVTFTLAAAALVAAPGPGQGLVLTRTFQGGTRAGVWTALGLEIGTAVHILAAALSLSTLLATSATAFGAVKLLGAGYLIFLGVRALRARGRAAGEASPRPPTPTAHLLAHAAVTGILNPKVAVFFLAFLPQFVDPRRGHPFLQFVLLGFGFAVLGLLGDSLVAGLAGRARGRFLATTSWASLRERLTGAVMIGLGLRLALERRP